jgi:DNA-binding LytR/AlgR family response regulator
MDFIIIDDEPAAIDVLKIHLEKVPFMTLNSEFRDPMDALEYLQSNTVDLIFLDINMPKLSGITFPTFLKNPPLIIFTTAYSEYALESYNLKAIDYLLKPIAFDRLLQAVMKAKEAMQKNEGNSNEIIPSTTASTIFIKSGSNFHQLEINSIRYIESEGNYVTFYTSKNSVVARYKISEILNKLPSQLFARIHRSYIVALSHINIVKKHCVVIDGKEIPISSNYRVALITIIENMKT